MQSDSRNDPEEVILDALSNARKAAIRMGMKDYEISASTSNDKRITIMPNGGRGVSSMDSKSLHVRVISNRRMGLAIANDFRTRQIDSCLMTAKRLAFHRPEDDRLKSFAAKGGTPRIVTDLADVEVANMDFAQENEMMDLMLHSAMGCDGDVTVTEGNITVSHGAEGVVNSNGIEVSETRTLLHAECASVCGAGREVSPECISAMTTRRAQLPVDKIGSNCASIASHCCKRISPKTEECDVVFSAQALGMGEAGLLTAILTSALSGMEVVNGSTFFANRLGERVASPRFSLRDDPTLSGHGGSCSFDGEGVYTRNKWLISDGVLKQYVWDSYHGSIAGVNSTGNAVRDPLTGMVSPLPLNMVVRGSDGGLDDLVSEIDHGYLIWGCQGAHTSNTQTGDFAFVASPGLMIRRGEIVGGVQGAMVSGNVLDLLSNLESVGSDATDFGCSLMPSMSFRDVKITTG